MSAATKFETPVFSEGASPTARVVRRGETFAMIAQDLFGAPQAGPLLESRNPRARRCGAVLVEGQRLFLPRHAEVRRWLESSPPRIVSLAARRGPDAKRPGKTKVPLLQAYLRSSAFRDQTAVMMEAGMAEDQGRQVWRGLASVDPVAATALLGAQPAAAVEGSLGARSLCALRAAARYRLRRVAAREARVLMLRLAEVLESTARRPGRVCRLLLTLERCPEELGRSLLRLLGCGPAEVSSVLGCLAERDEVAGEIVEYLRAPVTGDSRIDGRAQEFGLDLRSRAIVQLFDGARVSALARDRLTVELLGIGATARRLESGLPLLAAVARSIAAAAQRQTQLGNLVGEVPALRERIRIQLSISSSDSLLARALDEMRVCGRRVISPPLRAALNLAALLGARLEQSGPHLTERGLAALLEQGEPLSARPTGTALDRVHIAARAASAAVREQCRAGEVSLLAHVAQGLGRGIYPRELRRACRQVTASPRRMWAGFMDLVTTRSDRAERLSPVDLGANLLLFLDHSQAVDTLLPDHGWRRQEVVRALERSPDLLERVAGAVGPTRPLVGGGRVSARGGALVAAAWLLLHAGELSQGTELSRGGELGRVLGRVIRNLGPQVLLECGRCVSRASGDEPVRPTPPPYGPSRCYP